MQIFAHPVWVNLFFFVPLGAYFLSRNSSDLNRRKLWLAAVFGIAFGLVEAAVVVYLRAASNMLTTPVQTLLPQQVSAQLIAIETWREAATIIMLASIALISSKTWRARMIVFLWVFAFWDLFYYVFLKLFIQWPQSWTTFDTLFLIPRPWVSQIWFPITVDLATIMVIIFLNLYENSDN